MVEEDELEEEEAEGTLPLLLPMGVVMVIVMMEGCRARSIRSSLRRHCHHSWSMSIMLCSCVRAKGVYTCRNSTQSTYEIRLVAT
jgi:hypothetical protein